MKACEAGPHVSLAPATISFSFSCNKKRPTHLVRGAVLCSSRTVQPTLFESDTPPLDLNYLRHFLLVGSHGKPTGHKVHRLKDFHLCLCFEPFPCRGLFSPSRCVIISCLSSASSHSHKVAACNFIIKLSFLSMYTQQNHSRIY